MGPRELWLGDLRHRGLEYGLGVAVIAVIAAVVVVQHSVAESAENGVHDLAHRLGNNMLVVPAGTDPAQVDALDFGSAAMPQDYPQRIAASPLSEHVKLVHARLNGNVTVGDVPLILVGEGPAPRDESMTSQPPSIMLGPEAADELGVQPGAILTIAGVPAQVTGIVAPPPDGIGMGVFTSLPTAQAMLGQPGKINTMRLGGCWCRFDVPELAGDIEKLLPGTKAITVAGVLEAQKGTVATMKRYSAVLYALSLLMVGATVLALMTSQVRRSLREVGLLLTAGASTTMVQALVFVRACVLGAAGGIGGYLVGVFLTPPLGSRLAQVTLAPEPGLWFPIVVLCAGVSVLAAVVPARWAAGVDPCQVLRET